jgi:hypothetical protein
MMIHQLFILGDLRVTLQAVSVYLPIKHGINVIPGNWAPIRGD